MSVSTQRPSEDPDQAPVGPLPYRRVKSETVPLTRKLVEWFTTLDGTVCERDLSPAHVEYLGQKVKTNQHTSYNWAVATLDGKMHRVNGQHSSAMLAGLNGAFPIDGVVHLDTYEVDSLDALALLFLQFDPPVSSRSARDVHGVFQGIHPNLKKPNQSKLQKHFSQMAVDAVVYFRKVVEKQPSSVPSGRDRYLIMNRRKLHPFFEWTGELLDERTPQLKNITTIAAMFGTFEKNEAEARKFWEHVAHNNGYLEESHPASRLENWLMANKNWNNPDRVLNQKAFYQASVFAWNAYRLNKNIAAIRADASRGFTPISA